MKPIKECHNAFEAHVVKQRLENEGIPACILNENASRLIPVAAAIPSMGVQVVVDDADYDRARKLLGDNGPAQAETICPECGSADVSYTLGDNIFQRIGIAFLVCLCALSLNSPGHIRRHYRCRDCGRDFR